MTRGSILLGIGRAVVAGGVLVLLFVGYQLWGTGLTEAHHQALLRREFNTELHRAHAATTAPHPTTTLPSTTPSAPPEPAPTTAAPAIGQPVAVLVIPKIGLNTVVQEGVTAEQLRGGPGHYPGTSLPGEAGNVGIAGHRTTYAHPFYNLDALSPGDPIELQTTAGSFTYRVVHTVIVPPSDTAVIAPSSTNELTLTTCNPRYSAATRMVVQADLTSSSLDTPPAGSPATTVPTTVPARHGHRSVDQGSPTPWAPALWWGLAVVAASVLVWLIARQVRRKGARWLVIGVGMLGILGLLFVFFGAVSPLLPASF